MSKLLQIAAKLVTLPQEDAPEYLYAGCKQIASEIRDFHDTELAAKSAECEKLREELQDMRDHFLHNWEQPSEIVNEALSIFDSFAFFDDTPAALSRAEGKDDGR